MLTKRVAHPLGSAMCLLALLLLGISTASAQPRPRGRDITGSVVDVDNNPVANATVAVGGGGPSATTGADGAFKLTGVATTNVALEITADGYTAKQVPLLGATTALQLQVVIVKPAPAAPPPTTTRIVGGVVTDVGHAPVAGATVRVQGTTIQTVTGADGTFQLPGVAVAAVTLEIEAANQPPTTAPLTADQAAVVVTVGAPAPSAPVVPTTRTIRGKVIDPTSGQPIAAAEVTVVGTTAVVFTEADGAFVLENLPIAAVKLSVTAPEYETRAVNLPVGQDTVEVPLGLGKGEEIIVEGRAPLIVKTQLANGASVIDDKDLNRVSASTLDTAMTAKLPGANLQSNSGAPGGGSQLRLRGISTINGQSSPLYVIDGVIVSNVSISPGTNVITAAVGGGNPSPQDNPVNRMSDINPNDIETLEVLKGASAAALYGSKASNGVVVITTKRGRNGENHANVTQRVGFSQVSKKLGARVYTSVDDVPAGTEDAFIAANGKVYDHEAEIERTTFARETLGSVSGGNDNGNYFGSVLVSDNPGVLKGTFYEKQSGRIAVGYKFGDRIRLGITANLIHSVTDRGLTNNDNTGTSNYVALSGTPSFINLHPVNGVYPEDPGAAANPLQTVLFFQNREEVYRLIAGSSLSVDAYSNADGSSKVKLLANYGADAFNQKNELFSPSTLVYEAGDGLLGTLVDAPTTNLNWNVGTGAVWSYSGKGFRSALSGGLTYESVNLHSVYLIAQNLTAGQGNVDAASAVQTNENNLRTKDTGFYLQEEVALLDDRLSLLGGMLAERSSLNGDTDQYFLYPKLAAVFSVLTPPKAGEKQALDMFETLRVRAAYGEAGNRPNYGNKFTALSATGNVDGIGGLVPIGIAGDKGIEPERQREIELGVDLATKEQRVAVELTGYQRNISNLLLQRALPQSTGFITEFSNGGALRNRGIEAAVTVRPLPTNKIVDWTTRGTLTLNRSKVTETPDHLPFDITAAGFGTGLGAFRIEEGKSATQIVSTINPAGDVAVAGNGEPDFRIGWSNVVTAGDFTFTALLDWQHGSDVINLTRLLYDSNGNSPDVEAAAKRAESFSNGDPRPYIEDASFVKLREISISYSAPKSVLKQLSPLKSLQIQLSGRNLLTVTDYSGLDPEVSNFGGQAIGRNYDVGPYPPSRSYWLSVSAGI